MDDGRPIGVFDSGVGGLSVLREIRQQLPSEHLIYLADQAHVPYGSRPLEEIRFFAVAITRFLLQLGVKTIVVACNTASAAALSYLRQVFPQMPFVGMEPAVKPAAEQSQSRVIGVLATRATFQGELFASLIARYAKHTTVLEQVCPGWVEQVELGALDTPETEALVRVCVEPLILPPAGADTLVLGCTHFPFLLPLIQRFAGTGVQVVDPSPAVARQTGRVLAERGWSIAPGGPGGLSFITSGDVVAFERLAGSLLGTSIQAVGAQWDGDRLLMNSD